MKPFIEKLGTIAIDVVETTPIVFNNRLYRLEYVRTGYQHNRNIFGKPYHRLVDITTNSEVTYCAENHHLGSAIVDSDTVYVFAVKERWGGDTISVFYSEDLKNWKTQIALSLPGWSIFNNSICKTDKEFIMAIEIDNPPEETGIPFTIRFARSKDLLSWELTDSACVYAKDRYTACPTIRFF